MWSHEFLEKMYAGKRVQSTLGTGETARIIGSRSALVSKGIDDDDFIKTVIVVVRDTDQKELEIDLSDMGVLVTVIDEVKEANPCKQISLGLDSNGFIIPVVTDTHDKEQGTLTYHDVESRHATRGTSTWTPIDSGSVRHWAMGAFNNGYQFRNRHTQTPISREEFMKILRPIQKDILPSYGDVEYSIGNEWYKTTDFTLSGWADGNFGHNYKFRNANTGRNLPRETFIEIAKRRMKNVLTYHDVESKDPIFQEWSPISEGAMVLWLANKFDLAHEFRIKNTHEPITREEFMTIIRRSQE